MKIAATYSAVILSLLTVVITFVNVNRQGRVNADIEVIKATLAKEQAIHSVLVSVESQAYDDLLKAMSRYYHTLALAEIGVRDGERIDSADDKMTRVSHLASRLQPPCQDAFEGFWQLARNVNDSLRRLVASEKDPLLLETKVKQVWQDNVKKLGSAFEQFVEVCNRCHEVARRRSDIVSA